MQAGRAIWRDDPDPRRFPAFFPFTVYAINMGFAVALSISVGLWIPVVLALVLGLAPALIALAPYGWTAEAGTRIIAGPDFASRRKADAG